MKRVNKYIEELAPRVREYRSFPSLFSILHFAPLCHSDLPREDDVGVRIRAYIYVYTCPRFCPSVDRPKGVYTYYASRARAPVEDGERDTCASYSVSCVRACVRRAPRRTSHRVALDAQHAASVEVFVELVFTNTILRVRSAYSNRTFFIVVYIYI